MTTREVYEYVGSLPSSGAMSVDSRLDFGFIMSLVNQARGIIITDRWNRDRSIPREYYLTIEPTFNRLAQEDSCYVTFYNIPAIMALDGMATGMGYVGTINGIPKTFREVGTRAEFAAMQNDRIMKAGRKAYILLNGQGEMEVYYNDKIKEFRIDIIPADPLKVPTFNIDVDRYPIAMEDLSKIGNYLMSGGMTMPYKTMVDRINDGRDTTAQPLPRV